MPQAPPAIAGPGETGEDPGIMPSFPPSQRTVPALLEMQARRHGDRVLLRVGDVRWRFSEAPAIVARAAGRLAAAGIARGDRVAIMATNSAAFLECLLGCAWLGAIAVPINVASKGPSLQHIFANSAANLLIIEAALRPSLDTVANAPALIWDIDALPPPGAPAPPAPVGPGDTLGILYTSGTTGPSKGVCCPHAQYYWWGIVTGRLLGVVEGDVLCTCLPLFHTNALNTFFQALLHGATLVATQRFSASGFYRTLIESGATVTYVLGAMVPILLSRPPAEEERAHRVRVALAPGVPGHLHAIFTARTGITLLDGYGSTETNFTMGTTAAHLKPGSMGPLVDGFAARVADADDNELPPGVAGELLLRAEEPFAFATGYWAMPEKTIEAWRNLWFHTGDRVIRDADGTYRFVDRLKDAIRRRGENVSSFEVEQVLLTHPAIATCAVFPARSELAEDEVMTAIVRKPGATLDPVELTRFCERLLPYFAVPRYVVFDTELPATENGKIQKYKLIERGVTKDTWDREAAGVALKR
jgi:crotonobetaine/carnitine-CoA ligase